MLYLSRGILSELFRTREAREAEIHAAIVAMFTALAAELLDAGALDPRSLAQRLEYAQRCQFATAKNHAARNLLHALTGWLRSVTPELPVTMPPEWLEPAITATDTATFSGSLG